MSDKKDEYSNFFEEIKKFKEEQNKQKQRGLNDYNILTAVRKPHAEIGMHSNFLYSILNPNGLHYQGDLFVKLFIRYVLDIDNFGNNIKVEMEELTTENRRIDFTIKSDVYLIGIEMKIYASDEKYQIFDYHEELKKQSKNKKIKIYYLTLDGKNADKRSYTKENEMKNYTTISFKNDILKWLDKCIEEIQNITNLNEAIKQYKGVIKILTDNCYTGKIKQLKDELLNNDEYFDLAKEVSVAYEIANKEKSENIKNKYLSKLKDMLLDIQFDEYDWKAIDIVKQYIIRIIPCEYHYTIQIANKIQPFQPIIDKESKQKIIKDLKDIDKNFKYGWNKVYGVLEIKYNDMDNMSNTIRSLMQLK